ncbi:Uncharacterised protein [Mycobacteroides abscessus subsp. abscessus]|nr:Uncharacterised protein [Mycobacteroides abscessus subsp. abscessus]
MHTTRVGGPVTVSWTSPPPEVTTGTPGSALPSSSAVLRAPTTTARTALEPQRAQRKSASTRPHHRQLGLALFDAPPGPSHANGPVQ